MRQVSPKAVRLRSAVMCVVESLEGRRLLSASPSVKSEAGTVDSGFTTFAAQPSVAAVDPADGATNINRDDFISCDLNLLPNAGTSEVDPNTLNGNVTLTKTNDNEVVLGVVKTSGGGDSIVFTPDALLVANSLYTFKVTSGVKDLGGNSFQAFTSTFTTGTGSGTVPAGIRFDQIALPNATGHAYTAMAIGPDGDLYAADSEGYIYRYVINPDGTLGASKTIRTVIDNNVYNGTGATTESKKGERLICGMAFDPNSSAKHPTLWITSGFPAVASSPDWSGKISVLSGTNLSVYKDVVVNLPRSFKDHLTEGISFGPDGALYISQASNSAMGAPDTTWDLRSEHLLNASILRLDPSKISSFPLDAKTDSGGTYNPDAAGAPLTIYAEGIRNAYEPVWTDDGHLFAATNGSSSGGNSPAGNGVPAENDLPTQPDYLYNVVEGGYYGHPNPTQNHFVENGGNPTSGVDPGEVTAYPVGTQPDSDYKGFVYNFGNHESPDGDIEYKGNAFGGLLNGDLLITQYSGGDNIIALPRDGATIKTADVQQSIAGFTGFNEPLPLVEDYATGNIYVGEYGGEDIKLLRVDETPLAKAAEIASTQTQLLFNAPKGNSSNSLVETLVNAGSTELDISSITLSGTNSNCFTISNKGSLPISLLPGQSTDVSIRFTPPSGESAGLKTASLTVKSNDTGHPTFNIQLRGIEAASTSTADEPSLQSILNLYQIPVTVGDNDSTTANLPLPPQQPNDEINAQLFARANASTPIEVDMLGSFDTNASPVATLGSYSSADGTESALFSINSGSNDTVSPAINGATTFFAGAKAFGLYVESDQHGHTIFSEDSKNTFDAANPSGGHLMRVYAMKNTNGSTVANAYIVAVETQGGSTVDNQDEVFEIKNVKTISVAPANPPSVPTGLHVTNSVNTVTLAWNASNSLDVSGYIIKRSTNSKTNFIILTPSPVSGTTYTDTTPGKKKYYYRVFAEDSEGRLSDPAKVSTTVTSGVSSSETVQALSSQDIGNPTPAGSTGVISTGAAYNLIAGGADVQGASDQFRFASQQVTGNFDVKVRVANVSAANVWSKAGLMARSSLAANAANVFLMASPTKYRLTYRTTDGGQTQATGADTATAFPQTWLRLSRVGNVFTAYSSTDGKTWRPYATETVALPSTVSLGLAATSHNTSQTTTAEFRNYTSL